jgi:hypothetical protein
MYNSASQQQAQSGPQGGPTGGQSSSGNENKKPDDEVTDVDFEEVK